METQKMEKYNSLSCEQYLVGNSAKVRKLHFKILKNIREIKDKTEYIAKLEKNI